MTHPFPEESVRREYEIMQLFREESGKSTPLVKAEALVRTFEREGTYGFQDNLRTGAYAPWPHERDDQHIMRYNCTTIIPTIYLWAEALGFKPQIVQFKDFRQLRSKRDKDKPTNNSHFGLIVDVKRKHPYLIDPFWEICNPIVERTPQRMVLGKNKRRERAVREYGALWEYSPEEFAAMINDLHDPVRSLEMLACGQKVDDRIFLNKEVSCTLMVYYERPQGTDMILTRLEIPQVAIMDKVAMCGLLYDQQGKVGKTCLELCLAKDTSWTEVIGKVAVARGYWEQFESIRNALRVMSETKKRPRLSELVLKNPEAADTLYAVTTLVYEQLTEKERAALQKRIGVRTLYEYAEPGNDYLTTERERFSRIEELRQKEKDLEEKIRGLNDTMWKEEWKLERLEKKEARRLKSQRRRASQKKEKAVADLKDLLYLHWNDKLRYHRRMDRVAYSKRWENASEEVIQREVTEKGYDLRGGYAAMVADFLPFVFEDEEKLRLARFQGSIGEKIRARNSSSEE
ncbi:hypothetical protein HYT55_04910 [Candidatus Woesearchaeota archaeon]|nr:hypothetical protein [Candidatus Woesearchaeota archaeon]